MYAKCTRSPPWIVKKNGREGQDRERAGILTLLCDLGRTFFATWELAMLKSFGSMIKSANFCKALLKGLYLIPAFLGHRPFCFVFFFKKSHEPGNP